MKECKIQRTSKDLYRDITTLAEIGIFNKEGVRKLANIIRFVQAFSDYPEKESKKPGENKIIKFQPLERLINDSQSLIPSAIEFPPKEEIKEKSFVYIPLDPNEPSEFDESMSTEEESASSLVGDNRIGIYLKDIERYRPLTNDEQKELIRRIKAGDKIAREELINSSLRLVIYLAKEEREKRKKKTLSLNDLIQEGSIGFIRAIEKIDEEKSKILSYSGEYTKGYMKKAISNKYRLIRIPSYLHYFLSKWKRAIRMLEAKNGQTPTTSDILDYLNNKKITSAQRSIQEALKVDKNYLKLEDNLEDKNIAFEENHIDILSKDKLKEKIRYVLNTPTYKEREVIKMRYGLNAEEKKYTLEETAKMYGISRGRVSQIEANAIKKLRYPSRRKLLKEFV